MNRSYYTAVSMFCFLGCASGSALTGSSGPLASEYAPLVVGAYWTYDVNYPGQKGEMTVKLTSLKDGYFLDDRNGAFQHTLNGLRDRERYLIRGPIKAGATWKSVVGPSAVEHMKIEEVGASCESLAGRFDDCLIVSGRIRRDKNMQLLIRWTWARGVGLVKMETEAEVAGKGRLPQVSQNLKDYSLKPGTQPVAPLKPKQETQTEDDGPNTWISE